MKTVQMTLEDDLVSAVDQAAKRLQTTRSAFTRSALREALARMETTRQERKHREGYAKHPEGEKEFSAWEAEQDWGDS